ncbi:hypothetical protein Tco_1454815 [Tanacetum coccineum]
MNKTSRLGKGTVSDNILLCCVPDTAYGPHPIWRISEKLALAIEIDLTWSRGFVSVELGRLLNPLSCKTLLIYPICISKGWITASPSEVLVLLVLEDVLLCHFWEYSAISWMAILASMAVLEVLRTSQDGIEPDGWFLSHLLAAPVRDIGKAQSMI